MKKTVLFLPKFLILCVFTFFLPLFGFAQLHVTWSDLSPSYCTVANGHATAHVRGGTPPYRFTLKWAGIYDSSDSMLVNLYQYYNTITIKDSAGKEVEDGSNTLYINPYVGPKLKISILAQPSTTCSEDGLVKIDASLGDFGYTYRYDQNGGKSPLISKMAGGNYAILKEVPWGKYTFIGVDPTTGCATLDTFTLKPIDPKGFNVKTLITDTLLCRKSIRIVPNTYGFPPYIFEWVGRDDIKNAIAVIDPLQYTCKVTDATGCTILAGGLTKKSADSLSAKLYSTLPTCTEKGTITAEVKVGIAPYTYEWRTNNPYPDTSKIVSKKDTAKVGIGMYRLIIKDAWGCQATLDTTLFANCANYIAGHLYQDLINPCKYDEGEPSFPRHLGIYYLAGTFSGKEMGTEVDKNGYFKVHLPLGEYIVWTELLKNQFNPTKSFIACPDSNYYHVKILKEGDIAAHLDFAFQDPKIILATDVDVISPAAISLSPNPASTQITLQFFLEHNTPVGVQLLNTTGANINTLQAKTLLSSGTQSLTLALPPELADGLYFCRIETDKGVVVKKLLVFHF